ncbi:MAG: 50S ribosomal protein L29 [Chloroflexota bacterium]|nr:50S ribosomal protein L29 [Chloroflexota bacterium]
MKAQELREMTPEELTRTLEDLQREMVNLRFQLATRQLDNVSRMKQVRQDIARIKTIKRERELETEG